MNIQNMYKTEKQIQHIRIILQVTAVILPTLDSYCINLGQHMDVFHIRQLN